MRYLVIIFLLTLNGLVWLWGHDHLRSVGLPAPSLSTDASSERPNDAKAAKAAAEAAAETDGALAPDAARDVAPVALVSARCAGPPINTRRIHTHRRNANQRGTTTLYKRNEPVGDARQLLASAVLARRGKVRAIGCTDPPSGRRAVAAVTQPA